VLTALGPRFLLMGLSYKHDRARIHFTRKNVAGFNADLALASTRFVYSTSATFVQLTEDGVVDGPTESLRRV
jgi:hypothetical protein